MYASLRCIRLGPFGEAPEPFADAICLPMVYHKAGVRVRETNARA